MRGQYGLVAVFIALFSIGSASFWIFKNNLPPPWDQASYLEGSVYLYQSLTDKGLASFLIDTTIVLGSKAPLITILPVPLYLLFGSSYHTALMVNLIFMVIFYIFFYKLVTLIFDYKVALTSTVIVSTMPLFYGLARYFFVEFGLMTIVVIWMYLILKTKNLSNTKYLFLLGVISGLGMLMKFHFLMFVTGPLLIILWQSWEKIGSKLINFRNIAIFCVPALAIAAPWYFRNILTVLWKAKRATNPELLGNLYYGPPLSSGNIYLSGIDFINFVISPYWLCVLFILTAIFVYKRKRFKFNYFLPSWFILPFLVLYLGPNKDYRLMLPLLPPVAILIAWLLGQIAGKKQYLFLVVAMVFPLAIFLNTSFFNAKIIRNKISVGPLIFADLKIGEYVQVPRDEIWPVDKILEFIAARDGSNIKKVVLASENETININTFRYFSLLKKLPLDVKSGSYFPINTDYATIQRTVDDGDYLIMKLGGREGPYDLNRFNNLILERIDVSKWHKISNDNVLPDTGTIMIWQKS